MADPLPCRCRPCEGLHSPDCPRWDGREDLLAQDIDEAINAFGAASEKHGAFRMMGDDAAKNKRNAAKRKLKAAIAAWNTRATKEGT